jgi:hypothetical protein
MTVLKAAGWNVVLLLALSIPAAAQQPNCPNPQSPRDLNPATVPLPYDLTSRQSIVDWVPPAKEVQYRARRDCAPQTLHYCGQHFHAPVENLQGCKGEPKIRLTTDEVAKEVKPGDLVEIHTVYAAKVRPFADCDPVTLSCCEEGPFLVIAYSATVTAGGKEEPIVAPNARPYAEWSGSTTNDDNKPGECKPPAQWSFRMGCDFTVSEGQLKALQHPDPARPLQACNRLSRDLTRVPR